MFSSMVKMEVAPSPVNTYFTLPSPLSKSECSCEGKKTDSFLSASVKTSCEALSVNL